MGGEDQLLTIIERKRNSIIFSRRTQNDHQLTLLCPDFFHHCFHSRSLTVIGIPIELLVCLSFDWKWQSAASALETIIHMKKEQSYTQLSEIAKIDKNVKVLHGFVWVNKLEAKKENVLWLWKWNTITQKKETSRDKRFGAFKKKTRTNEEYFLALALSLVTEIPSSFSRQ